ncbi:MAG: alanine racemase [Clostridiaceae bacterium]|nr:alanine racemase [Clostridiaceae bacterium]
MFERVGNPDRERVWAEVDLNALEHNIRVLRAGMRPGCKFMAMIKANAYGHGAIICAERAVSAGADALGVVRFDEAFELRTAGIDAPILIVSPLPDATLADALEIGCILTVDQPEQMRLLSAIAVKSGCTVDVHLKVDSGMHRLGIDPTDPRAIEEWVALCDLPGTRLSGVYTHFAYADFPEQTETSVQFARFADFVARLKAASGRELVVHAAASAALMRWPEYHADMVRCGAAIYGLHLDNCEDLPVNAELRPVMAVKAQLIRKRLLRPGDRVSYGGRFTVTEPMVVAVAGIGYGDGYPRILSGRAYGMIEGCPVPQIGTICMDSCLFDLTPYQKLKGLSAEQLLVDPGPEIITLLGDGLTAETLAEWGETIGHEIITGISSRVPRYPRC